MLILTIDNLNEWGTPRLLNESTDQMHLMMQEREPEKKYDIFLSHSYQDKKIAAQLRAKLVVEYQFSVFVDGIDAPELSRDEVTLETVASLRQAIMGCKCFLYLTTGTTSNSKWMPWELGFVEGQNNKAAIFPVLRQKFSSFHGHGYLGVYPYIGEAFAKQMGKKYLWVNYPNGTSDTQELNEWIKAP